MKTRNIGNLKVYTELDVNVDINKPIRLERTIEDFNNNQSLFNLYKQINDVFKRYEERMIAERKNKS